MAATEQTYYNQRRLDIVFGVSCLLMLAGVVWMFAQDHFRDYKVEQRTFRDVETALAEREMLQLLPDEEAMQKIEAAEKELAEAYAERQAEKEKIRAKISGYLPQKAKLEAKVGALKAELDSEMSFFNLKTEERNRLEKDAPSYQVRDREAKAHQDRTDQIRQEMDRVRRDLEKIEGTIKEAESAEKEVNRRVAEAEKALKQLTADFDRFAKLAAQKQWKTGDWVRSLPVLDAFASPTRVQQYTLANLPIDYNFKYVTRFDRCTTCHLGIDRGACTKEALRDLTEAPAEDAQARLKSAKVMLRKRREILAAKKPEFDEGDLPRLVRQVPLSDAQITQFCAHPRLDLFVGGNSYHPAERFGCTICHAGQGGATEFLAATHTPNNSLQKDRWAKEKGWRLSHYWDFPMLPARFIESSCIKCHHQVIDLLPEGNKVEYREVSRKGPKGERIKKRVKIDAPGAKVVRGYNLVRELGCFGCHEISGIKNGRWVGPDLRLEPSPPLESLTPAERAKALADPANPPGTMRKVGPSLRRIAEKSNEEWARKWIVNPRGFRPNTRMPHFYNLSNNNKSVLPPDQQNFPEAEIHAVAFYLFQASAAHLADPNTKPLPNPQLSPAYKEDKVRGRKLFTEKGCLACHLHGGTEREDPAHHFAAVKSESHFGPTLTWLAAKLGTKAGDKESARRWLIQWLKDPSFHSPRTLMPVTHLTDDEAADVAAWLLDQPVAWNPPDVEDPSLKVFQDLARVHLAKTMSSYEIDELFQDPSLEKLADELAKDPALQNVFGADARKKLGEKLDAEGKLKLYIGKKAIGQMGCFGCHDIPGFENAKQIGTPLNDWGKKDPERLAFEDVLTYVDNHYYRHPDGSILNEKGHGRLPRGDKEPYEKFFFDALEHHQREGFLHQKLREPRSFDHGRIKSWDERLRMPQFRFAYGEIKPLEGETPEQARVRAEAEAREAVMTFVLGLVAEPIPEPYLYNPSADKLAVVKGKKILDKYNCSGCHQTRAGTFDFDIRARLVDGRKQRPALEKLQSAHSLLTRQEVFAGDFAGDRDFRNHNAWVGKLSTDPDRLKMRGLPTKQSENAVTIRLTQAVRFSRPEDADLPFGERDKKALDIPATESVDLPVAELLFRAEPEGGVFTDLLAPYLIRQAQAGVQGRESFADDPNARSGLPPPLLREGERVQPDWLFRFLRDPQPIRPVVVLRMPRFNMSEDEAQALVNYFAAVDRLENPGIGLTAPYLAIPQRDANYWDALSKEYTARLVRQKLLDARIKELRPLWELKLKERLVEVEAELKIAEKDLKGTKESGKKAAAEKLEEIRKKWNQLNDEANGKEEGPFVRELREEWEKQASAATAGYRLLANKGLCLACHKVGSLDPKQLLGPPLDLAADRLRPDWTQRWLANPQRMMIYPGGFHPMPQNFKGNQVEHQEFFTGTSLEQATALRDVLMSFPRVSRMPANRFYQPPGGSVP